jgi:hypothetical protein
MRRVHVAAIGGAAAALFMAPTAAAADGAVAGTVSVGTGRLAVRVAATVTSEQVDGLTNKTRVTIACQVTGDRLTGRVRTTDKWDRLTNGQYVSDAFIKRNTKTVIPACPPPAPPPVPTTIYSLDGSTGQLELTKPAWVVPVPKTDIGGFRTVARPQHDGVDLPHAKDTPIVSVAAGTVVTVRCNASTPSCDVDGSPSTRGCGWYVEVRHAHDVVTRYCHLIRRPVVAVGDRVGAGQLLGHVGSSGHSSGPHLHFEVHAGYPASRANAIDPVAFVRSVGAPL